MRAYETCCQCGGTGLALNMAGEPDKCPECKGDTVVRARDASGRFVCPHTTKTEGTRP